MKILIIVSSLILNLNAVWAQDLGVKSEINKNWSYTKLYTRTDNHSVLKFKMLKRYLWIDKKPVQIAETTFTYLKNPQDKIDLKSLSETIKKSFPEKTLTSHAISNGVALEGHWKKINRYIKMDLVKKGDSLIIVTSFARSGLISSLMPELNELHSLLNSYEEKAAPKTSFISFFIEEARAAGFNPADYASFLTGSNTTTGAGTNYTGGGIPTGAGSTPDANALAAGGIPGAGGLGAMTVNSNVTMGMSPEVNSNWTTTNTNLENLNTNLSGANANWANTNTSLGNFNTTLSGANTNWADTNTKLGEATTLMDSQLTDINKNWSETNGKIDTITGKVDTITGKIDNATTMIDKQMTDVNKNWEKSNEMINTNWAESNKIAAKMMDPNHMAKLAMYTAAGAALGGIAVNLAVSGVSAGISFLYELFTGTQKKKLAWEDFQKATQSWDDQLNGLVKLEQIVDEFIGAFDFFSDKNLDNNYVQNLNLVMRDMRFDRDMMMEKFNNKDLSTECRRVFHNAADELDQKLKEYDKIAQFAGKNNIPGNKSENYFCQQLKELERKLLGAEVQMQDLRLAILKAENQFYSKSTDAKEQREDNTEEVNDKVGKTIKARKNYNKTATKDLKESHKKERKEWISACVDAENPEGKKIKAQIDNRFLHFFKAKSMCSAHFDKENPYKGRGEKEQQIFAAENELRSDLKLSNNPEIDVKLSEEQLNWLTRIHVDAYCYQYAHVEEKKVPAKCREFPEMLYSMNLSKGYEKAKAAYKNRCEERYLMGVSRLGKK